MKMITFLN